MGTRILIRGLALLAVATCSWAADYPPPQEGDYVIKDFSFRSGQSLPEVRMHFRTLGSPQRDRKGLVCNAVLILHGTTGSGAQFIRPEFAGELFGEGQLLDARRYYLIIPESDNTRGHGTHTLAAIWKKHLSVLLRQSQRYDG